MFITFEGIDCSGKTTQSNLLKEYLKKRGYKVLLTREPGGTKIGEKIRKLLLKIDEQLDFFTEIYLHFADRNEHCVKIIKPALLEDKIVICDRFYDSTIAYQGYGRIIDPSKIKYLNKYFVKNYQPEITFFIDTPINIIKKRLSKKFLDRIEKEGISFMKKVRKGYLDLIKEEPNRFYVLDGSQDKEKNQEKIQKYLSENFNL